MRSDVKLTSHSSISLVDDWCRLMMSNDREREKREKVSWLTSSFSFFSRSSSYVQQHQVNRKRHDVWEGKRRQYDKNDSSNRRLVVNLKKKVKEWINSLKISNSLFLYIEKINENDSISLLLQCIRLPALEDIESFFSRLVIRPYCHRFSWGLKLAGKTETRRRRKKKKWKNIRHAVKQTFAVSFLPFAIQTHLT